MDAGALSGNVFDIPPFNISGVLPPYLGSTPTAWASISPYQTTLFRIADRFCNSKERKEILQGLLDYRQRLNRIGLLSGFQWLSGSFLENIEVLEGRHPRDVDVVTFCHRPIDVMDDVNWEAFVASNDELVNPIKIKEAFKCDAYFVDLNIEPISVVDHTRYWFGLFSHRRGGLWKGMLQIPLTVNMDDEAASKRVML
jgi:hypothetical protein